MCIEENQLVSSLPSFDWVGLYSFVDWGVWAMSCAESRWVCAECGEVITEANFWSHEHKQYGEELMRK